MKRKTLTAIVLPMLIAMLIAGCKYEPQKPQAVILDIDRVKEVTGIKAQIQASAEALNEQFSAEMEVLSAQLNNDIEAIKAGLGDRPLKVDKDKALELQEQLKKQFLLTRNEKYAQLEQKASEARQSYIDRIMAVAQQVAIEHGASVILRSRLVLWSDSALEVTDEVIGRIPESKQ